MGKKKREEIVDNEGGGHTGYLLRQWLRAEPSAEEESHAFGVALHLLERVEYAEELVQAQAKSILNLEHRCTHLEDENHELREQLAKADSSS